MGAERNKGRCPPETKSFKERYFDNMIAAITTKQGTHLIDKVYGEGHLNTPKDKGAYMQHINITISIKNKS